MVFQNVGNKYWKPNLDDPTQLLPSYGRPSLLPSSTTTAPTNAANVESITNLINEINQSAQQSANAGRIPGGLGLEQQSSANIASALSGQVDPSTINLLGQQAAERGASTGSPLGAGSEAAYLRALGLTSMDRMNTGQNWLSQATARNPAAPIYGAQNRFLTAEQEQQAILAREEMANRLRIAQMHYANRGGGGNTGYARGAGSMTPGIASASSNWLDRLIPSAPVSGWSFPPGYSSIPIGGSPVTDNNVTDQDILDMWLPPDTGGAMDNQFDYNDYSDMLGGYA